MQSSLPTNNNDDDGAVPAHEGYEHERDPIPGLVLFFYLLLIYLFLATSLVGCGMGSDWSFVLGSSARSRNVARMRAIPGDHTTCQTEFRPWNESCDNR